MTDFSSCIRLRCFQLEKQGKTHRSSRLVAPRATFVLAVSLRLYIYLKKKKKGKEKNERTIVQGRKSLICIKSSTYELCYGKLKIDPAKKSTCLSTSTFGSAFIAASRMLGSRCGSAAGENGLVGLVVMYWGDAFLNSPVPVVYVTRLEEENESPVVCSSIAENTWFWPNVTIFGEPGPDSSSLISSGTMSAGCGDRGGELGSGLDVSTVCVVPTCAKDTTETTWSAATASSVSWAITLSVCSITWRTTNFFFSSLLIISHEPIYFSARSPFRQELLSFEIKVYILSEHLLRDNIVKRREFCVYI